MLHDLIEIASQHVGNLVDLASQRVVDVGSRERLPEFVDQLDRNGRKIVDEVEWIFDFVRDPGGQLSQRCKLLGLNEAILRGTQFLQRLPQLARARFYVFKQADVLDRDGRLVGESRDQFDLLVGKGPHFVTC